MRKGEILINKKGIEAKIVEVIDDYVEIVQSNGYRFQVEKSKLRKEIRKGNLKWKERNLTKS